MRPVRETRWSAFAYRVELLHNMLIVFTAIFIRER